MNQLTEMFILFLGNWFKAAYFSILHIKENSFAGLQCQCDDKVKDKLF